MNTSQVSYFAMSWTTGRIAKLRLPKYVITVILYGTVPVSLRSRDTADLTDCGLISSCVISLRRDRSVCVCKYRPLVQLERLDLLTGQLSGTDVMIPDGAKQGPGTAIHTGPTLAKPGSRRCREQSF